MVENHKRYVRQNKRTKLKQKLQIMPPAVTQY